MEEFKIKITDICDLKFKGYKTYTDITKINIPYIKHLNVVIGKNGSGKSNFLEIIPILIGQRSIEELHAAICISKDMLANLSSCGGRGESYNNGYSIVKKHELIGTKITFSYAKQIFRSAFISQDNDNNSKLNKTDRNRIIEALNISLSNYAIIKLSANRDIRPEKDNKENKIFKETGENATSVVMNNLFGDSSPAELIEKDLLSDLNEIMSDDAQFTRIQALRDKDDLWEIYLTEKEGKRFPLSRCGSSLKTIILILLDLLVIPQVKDYKDKKIIFCFEELENNLHPALQRRLFEYLYQYAIKKDRPIFLTTHSHVAIDMFYNREKAQILHVEKEKNISSIHNVETYFDKVAILDDLCIKASDLFQTNGIIWVEGPSDRIYIKKWLEIFCGSKYIEGTHFQFICYGGKLLSHYSTDNVDNKINILLTNRNSAIVIDSDKKGKFHKINETKRKVRDEFKSKHKFCWITKGKEIENYLPKEAISQFTKSKMKQCGQFQIFSNYINSKYKNFRNKKVEFANQIKEYITKENSEKILDLKNQIEELYKQIEEWNKID